MASTFKQAITTQINLNGQDRTTENLLEIANIDQFDNRIINIPFATETQIARFGTAVGPGTFIPGQLRYFQATNMDAVNYARIRVSKSGVNNYCFDVKVDPKQTFLMSNSKMNASQSSATFIQFVDADTISAQADQTAIDLEIIIVSV